MNFWLPLAILPTLAAPLTEQKRSVEVIYSMEFESEADTNFDDWPDNWTRRHGRDFPLYVEIGIVDDSEPLPNSGRCLRMDLDGGGGEIFSPMIEISPLFSYQLRGYIKTESLQHNRACFSITFLDAKQEHRETYKSARMVEAPSWKQLKIGPIMSTETKFRYAVIGLHLTPTDQSDFSGAGMFDRLQLVRLPRMALATNGQHNIFRDPRDVEVSCEVSGAQQPGQELHLELLDQDDRTMAMCNLRMDEILPQGADAATGIDWSVEQVPREGGVVGSLTWRPSIKECGHYRIRGSMHQDGHCILERNLALAITREKRAHTSGRFGWSLPRGEHPLPFDELVNLLQASGVRWVKFPVWSRYSDGQAMTRLAQFSDQLSSLGVELVGMFDKPPAALRDAFENKRHLTVAEVFMHPDVWQPALDPMLVRLIPKIRCWQLGLDRDKSFIDFPELEQTVQEVRRYVKRHGQETKLVLPWRWMHQVPVAELPAWDALSMFTSPAFTPGELDFHLEQQQQESLRTQNPGHWINLQPLPKTQYDFDTRTADLVLRMLAARVQQAEAIFLQDPFDPEADVLNSDGTPGNLFLPWSTTVGMISGADHLGQMVLPNGSKNHLFAHGDDVVMVVWNEQPTSETLYLGEHPRQFDLWNREIPIQQAGGSQRPQQTISVGKLPTFVLGLNEEVTRWRLGLRFEQEDLESIFGHFQVIKYRVRNSFPRGVAGQLALQVPDEWEVQGHEHPIKMDAGEELACEFEVLLHSDATSGAQPVQFDFDLSADDCRFSVYRFLRVGLGDVTVELDTWLDDNGRLIVEQTLLNKARQSMNFDCLLFAPGRRRLRQQVFDLQPGRAVNQFVLDNGQQLLGKRLWLRVEEIDGRRLLNFDITAEP